MRISMSRPPGIESNLRLTTILPPKTFSDSRAVEKFAKLLSDVERIVVRGLILLPRGRQEMRADRCGSKV